MKFVSYCFYEMDTNGGGRVVIAKPVASRPTSSNFRSFSELLAGAINASPNASEAATAAIRPKTVRFKPGANHAPTTMVSSQVPESDAKHTLYKPQAKLVSKTIVSRLANMGNIGNSHQQTLLEVEARAQQMSQEKKIFRSQFSADVHHGIAPSGPSCVDKEQTSEPSKNMDEDPKVLPANTDRPSYDGYNWRKYGQKQVKGSEYPRSYYKCTHLNCPVKKKVERSFDGQITEIVYKGEHNHVKPYKRNSLGMQGVEITPDGTATAQAVNNSVWSNQQNEKQEGPEGRIGNENEVGLSARLSYQGKDGERYEPVSLRAINAGFGTSENSNGECEDVAKEGEDDEPRSKKRKSENLSNEVGTSGEGVPENTTDSEVVGDGFRWRKYGQKVVKGNPYPRSYYRCTSLKCNVRKHVERTSDDPRSCVTTYEGKHNHEMPLKKHKA